MSVVVHEEPHEMGDVLEKCCFCRKPTRWWVTDVDVACCQPCALRANPEDVPRKSVWIRRERIADGSSIWRADT